MEKKDWASLKPSKSQGRKGISWPCQAAKSATKEELQLVIQSQQQKMNEMDEKITELYGALQGMIGKDTTNSQL